MVLIYPIKGLIRGDLIVKFGQLVYTSFTSGSLTPVAELVGSSENVSLLFSN